MDDLEHMQDEIREIREMAKFLINKCDKILAKKQPPRERALMLAKRIESFGDSKTTLTILEQMDVMRRRGFVTEQEITVFEQQYAQVLEDEQVHSAPNAVA